MQSGHPVDLHGAHGHMAMPPIQHMQLGEPPDLRSKPPLELLARVIKAPRSNVDCRAVGTGSLPRSSYPEYNNQGLATNWSLPEATASSSRGTYGHDVTQGLGPSAFPAYNHTNTPPPSATGWPDSAARGDMSWPSYAPQQPPPPQTQQQQQQQPQPGQQQPYSPMSQIPTPTAGAYERRTPTSSMPAAEMYPPLPNMAPESAGPSISPPGHSSAAAAAGGYGGWQPQAYQPISNRPGEGYGGGWYSQAEGGHAQPAMAPGLPVTEGYYTQR